MKGLYETVIEEYIGICGEKCSDVTEKKFAKPVHPATDSLLEATLIF